MLSLDSPFCTYVKKNSTTAFSPRILKSKNWPIMGTDTIFIDYRNLKSRIEPRDPTM